MARVPEFRGDGMEIGIQTIGYMLSAGYAFERAEEWERYRIANREALIRMGKDWKPADERLKAKAEMWRREGAKRALGETRSEWRHSHG